MARSLSHSLTRLSALSSPSSSSSRLLKLRLRSSSLEMEAEERVALKKLEEAIHKIIVKRSEPNWLPFVPGASYWVPPTSKAQGLAHVITKLLNNNNNNNNNNSSNLIKDNHFSLSSNRTRGWPSSSTLFFKGTSHSPLEGDTTTKNTSQSEDEEG